MINPCLLLTLLILVTYLTEIRSVPLKFVSKNALKSPVEVRIVHHRKKRSIDSSEEYYDVELKAFDKTHKLTLRSPPDSLFSDNFQYHDVEVDADGNVEHVERTPSKREIQSIEQNIYVDADANAVLRVRNVDGEFQLEGLLDTMRIGRDANNQTEAVEEGESVDMSPKHNTSSTDYIDLQRPVATPRGLSTEKISVSPEVAFVLDYENSKSFNFDAAKIMDYVAVLLNSANNRYATVDDPRITFKLSGIFSIKSLAGQPFLEKSKVDGGKVQIENVLTLYKDWVFANLKDFPKHDLIPLLFAPEPSSGVIGLAYVAGACWVNAQQKSVMATSVSHDVGGSWKGALTVTHELGHNLGAPHDGETKASKCPFKGGYIMSYEGYGTLNKFTFSPCSASIMKEFIQSTGGSCLWTKDNKAPPKEIAGSIGDRISMVDMCKKRTGNQNTTLSKTDPNEQCLELACKVTTVTRVENTIKTSWRKTTYGELPGDNSACGTSGKCKNGKCVG